MPIMFELMDWSPLVHAHDAYALSSHGHHHDPFGDLPPMKLNAWSGHSVASGKQALIFFSSCALIATLDHTIQIPSINVSVSWVPTGRQELE